MNQTKAAKSPFIELNEIVKEYKNHRALHEVSLEVGPGVTGLLGPNGSGKSTLIKVLLGLLKVTSGSGTVMGHDIATEGRSIRELVGYMPEDDCYIAGLTGVEVVRFAACLSGLPLLEGLRRAHEILDFAGAEQERYRDIDKYSTGMRQKVKFAQAIVHDPPFLIFDEPTSSLDPVERDAMLARIRNLSKVHGKAVLISTHILPDVEAVCDQVIILSEGKVRVDRPLQELQRPSSPGLTITTTSHNEPLRAIFERQNRLTKLLGDTSFLLEDATEADTDLIWSAAAQAGVGIVSIEPMSNSLETIFMEAVRKGRDAKA